MHLRKPYYILGIMLILLSCNPPAQQAENIAKEDVKTNDTPRFAIHRGVNISHWLSQSKQRGKERESYFTQDDVGFIASSGFDHVRIPVDEEQLWDESGKKHPEAFKLLHDAIAWCQKAELKVIVDLHILRSHYFNANFDGSENTLFTSEASQNQFYGFWQELSAELAKYPTDFLAYELMNEPIADNPEDWNKLVQKCTAVIREREPARKIIIGSNMWQQPITFDELEVPKNDPNIILSLHFYYPMMLTHYQASWVETGVYDGPVHYPGPTVKEEHLEGLPEDLVQKIKESSGDFNPTHLLSLLEKPLKKAKETGLQLYCGEWGCYHKAPKPDRLRWYADMRKNLEENDIAWTTWDYKGSFGIKSNDTGEVNSDLIHILTGSTSPAN